METEVETERFGKNENPGQPVLSGAQASRLQGDPRPSSSGAWKPHWGQAAEAGRSTMALGQLPRGTVTPPSVPSGPRLTQGIPPSKGPAEDTLCDNVGLGSEATSRKHPSLKPGVVFQHCPVPPRDLASAITFLLSSSPLS